MNAYRLLEVYEQISEAPDAIARLRRFVLDLAVRGKLVPQDAGDEPAHLLAQRTEAEKNRLVKAGAIRKRDAKPVSMLPPPYEIPTTWCWTAVGTSFAYDAGVKTDPRNLDADQWLLELEDVEKETGRLLQRLNVADREARSTKSKFQIGDVLYGKLRPYLNKVVVADQSGYSTTEIVAIRPYLPLCSEYVALAFRRPDFVNYVEQKGQGTKMPRLRTEDAVVAPFPLPPLAEQHRIVAKVDELMALCDRLEEARKTREEVRDKLTAASLARLTAPETTQASSGKVGTGLPSDEATIEADDFPTRAAFALEAFPALTTRPDQIKTLRQTILNLAVRGKLVEQDPADEPASDLLVRIARRKAEILSSSGMRKPRKVPDLDPNDIWAELPYNWTWTQISELGFISPRNEADNDAEASFVPMPMIATEYGATNDHEPRTWGEIKKGYTHFAEGDVGLAKITPCFENGKSTVFRGLNGGFGSGTTELHILRPVLVDPDYVVLYLKSPQFIGTGIPRMTGTAGQKRVPSEYFTSSPFPLPPLAEQHRIVAKVDALMALCDRLETALTTTDTTRTRLLEALLHEALDPVAQQDTAA